MPKPAAKLSISIPFELAEVVRKRVGARGLSGFVARALQHELEREQLGAFLVDLEDHLGPVPAKVIAEARTAWRRR